ncbi:MAG: helix-turn-helix transcriptional regulator [Clostridia bacterium]|nr:helix-turn-helix transcriptional regulator [Clostridia bacterium]
MRCHLSTLMGQSRYSIQDVHVKTGLARSTVTQLYHDKATRIDFETIEKLCALFDCDISSLLELEGIKKENDRNG